MIPIPPEIKIFYDTALVKKGVPQTAHSHYRKWLRYYLDFCLKYHHQPANKESLAPFGQKLKDKKQTEQQRKQASDAVSIFYELEKKWTNLDNAPVLNTKDANISIKKAELKSTNADWRSGYNGLDSEIKNLTIDFEIFYIIS